MNPFTKLIELSFVHHCRPRAQAIPLTRSGKPATKQIWYPVWGLWQVDRTLSHETDCKPLHTIASWPVIVQLHQLAHIDCLPAGPKVLYTNQFLFGREHH